MRKVILSGFLAIILSAVACNGQPDQEQAVTLSSGNDVEVYYFHLTTRCVTCKTIEAEARKNIEVLYPELVKSGKISFTAMNLEEGAGKSMSERLGVNGQTLLIVKGDQKINITNEGFLYAVSKPDKFKEIIREKVDPLFK